MALLYVSRDRRRVRQGQVFVDFVAMVTRPAKTVNETRELIMETDRKLKEIRDLTEEGVSDIHAKSVLIGFADQMTTQHTAHRQGDPFEVFKLAVVEFTNAVATSTAAMDDIKSEPMQLGKVEDGKGPVGGCSTCGGPHFASDCPWTTSSTYQLGVVSSRLGVQTHIAGQIDSSRRRPSQPTRVLKLTNRLTHAVSTIPSQPYLMRPCQEVQPVPASKSANNT